MDIAFTLPVWLMWVLGIVGGLIGLGLMAFGILFIICFWNFRIM